MCLLRMATHRVDLDSDSEEPVPEIIPEAAVAVSAAVELPGDAEEQWTEEESRLMKRRRVAASAVADSVAVELRCAAGPPQPWGWWDFAVHGVHGSTDLPNVKGNALIVAMMSKHDGVVDGWGAFTVPGHEQTRCPWVQWPVLLTGASVHSCTVVRGCCGANSAAISTTSTSHAHALRHTSST